MNKFIACFLFLLAVLTLKAEKQYVTVYCPINNGTAVRLSGDIPSSMKDTYYANDFQMDVYTTVNYWMGNVLNLLAKHGYEVEQMTSTHADTTPVMVYLLSRDADQSVVSSPRPTNADSEAVEMARYNLKGELIGANEKGIQIIVYSDYTTETVINE